MVEGVPNHCPVESEARVLAALRRLFCTADFELDTFHSGPRFLNPRETQQQPDLIILALQLSNLWRLSREPFCQGHPNLASAMVARINEGRGDRIRSTGAVAELNTPLTEKPLRETIPVVMRASTANQLTRHGPHGPRCTEKEYTR